MLRPRSGVAGALFVAGLAAAGVLGVVATLALVGADLLRGGEFYVFSLGYVVPIFLASAPVFVVGFMLVGWPVWLALEATGRRSRPVASVAGALGCTLAGLMLLVLVSWGGWTPGSPWSCLLLAPSGAVGGLVARSLGYAPALTTG